VLMIGVDCDNTLSVGRRGRPLASTH